VQISLVLGAGLGVEYGFPDGPTLKVRIAKSLSPTDSKLLDIFNYYPAFTVDEIVARFPEHAETIRRLLMQILWSEEKPKLLKQLDRPNTYGLMLAQVSAALAAGHSVKIFTFNYDRSLQEMQQRFNAIMPEGTRVDPNLIVALYGRLSPLFHEDPDRQRPRRYHDYGPPPIPSGVNAEYQRTADLDDISRSSKIRFISEGTEIDSVAQYLKDSQRIFFLGFGYHSQNLKALGYGFGKQPIGKLIAGTGLGLNSDQVASIKTFYPGITKIEDCTALDFLRFKFSVSEPELHQF